MRSLYVSAAQILVTHRESQPAGFLHYVHPADRSKGEALALAQALHQQLQQDPSRFAALALSSSDDRVSGELGGELGTFRPLNVMQPLADALGHIEPGEISRVVESEVGFHILERLAPPQDQPLSFAHIVIKHAQANGWYRIDRPVITHTKEQGRALADEVAAKLAADPSRFVELVRQYSESDDATRDGDAGQYSLYDEPGAEFVIMQQLRHMAVGQVSRVYETGMGFEIFQRTSPGAREQLAASIIALPYQGAQIERFSLARRSKERARHVADKLLAELKIRPEVFAQRRIEYCDGMYCDATAAWRRGAGVPAIESALSALAPGELAPEPIDSPLGFLLIRREDPSLVQNAQPAPIVDYRAVPPLEPATLRAQAPSLVEQVQAMGRHALTELRLSPESERQYVQLFLELDRRLKAQDPAHADVAPQLMWIDQRVHELLGEDGYDEYDRSRRRWSAAHNL